MAVPKEIGRALENEDLILSERIELANNLFTSLEVPSKHKEAFVIIWLLKLGNEEGDINWKYLHAWLSSFQFKELTRNEISNHEINTIMELFTKRILNLEKNEMEATVFEISSLLIQHKAFQQYYKTSVAVYCKFISAVLFKISSNSQLTRFLRLDVFPKSLISEENFIKEFFGICLPSFISCMFRMDNTLNDISRIIQKCVFYNNHKSFDLYISQFFEEVKPKKQPIPKATFKYIADIYPHEQSNMYYKVLFHAFANAYNNDLLLIYKLFILLVYMLGFNFEDKQLVPHVSKLQVAHNDLSKTVSQEILSEILEVLNSITSDNSVTVRNVSLSKFLEEILKGIMTEHRPSKVSYNIIIKAFHVDPLIAQHLIDSIILYAMPTENEKQRKEYENLIRAIFGVYAKLHQVESLLSKIVNNLYTHFIEEKPGMSDGNKERKNYKNVDPEIVARSILPSTILKEFSHSIETLASWQVINVFKTLLHSLNKVVMIDDNSDLGNMHYIYLNVLSTLLSTFLSSARVAEHTVSSNTVDKFVKCLEQLREHLEKLGQGLLKGKKDNKMMKPFLNIAFEWAEVYMVLEYYSTNDIQMKKSYNDAVAHCNLSYLHNYLEQEDWATLQEAILISDDEECKRLFKNLCIQNFRALHLFQDNHSEGNISATIQSLILNLEDNLDNFMNSNFIFDSLLNHFEKRSIISLAEKLLHKQETLNSFQSKLNIYGSPTFINVMNYTVITKINKTMKKQKRKSDQDVPEMISAQIYSIFTEDMFIHTANYQNLVNNAKQLLSFNSHRNHKAALKVDEDKLIEIINILRKFPIIFSSDTIQQMVLLYFVGLHKDLEYEFDSGHCVQLKICIEEVVIGIIQQCKFNLSDIFDLGLLTLYTIDHYTNWEKIFTLTIENMFKWNTFDQFPSITKKLMDNILQENYMTSGLIIMNQIDKVKKNRMSSEMKDVCDHYKSTLFEKIWLQAQRNTPTNVLLLGYAHALKYYLGQNYKQGTELETNLKQYVDFALKSSDYVGSVTLFITVSQNKSLISTLEKGILLNIWNACKEKNSVFNKQDAYSKLVVNISQHTSLEEFEIITKDLLSVTESAIDESNYDKLIIDLQTWDSIVSCNFGTDKTKLLQQAIQSLMLKLAWVLGSHSLESDVIQKIFDFQKCLLQNTHFHMTQAMIDTCFLCLTTAMQKINKEFNYVCNLTISILLALLKYRKPLMMDRLNAYLQQYRTILQRLSLESNSELNSDPAHIQQVADCAHQLEKLTKSLITCQADVSRIAVYLIADILNQYEKVPLYPNVKIHFDNCIYTLMSLCDQHAVSFLMRVLSNASTEIFKIMYDNYKKYHRFTGKV